MEVEVLSGKSVALQELEIFEQFLKKSSRLELLDNANYIFNRVCYYIGKIKGTDEESLVFRFRKVFDEVIPYLENEEIVQSSEKRVNWEEFSLFEPDQDRTDRISTKYDELDFTDVEMYEVNVISYLGEQLTGFIDGASYTKCEMSHQDMIFLNGVIRKTKPKTIVEIGTAAGGSSCVILNAIHDMDDSRLYSFDYNTMWYREQAVNGRKSGFLVKEIIPEQMHKWQLITGGVSCKYFEQYLPEEGVDICLLDTVNHNPGEHINVLEILPFMKKNGIIIYHDTGLHSLYDVTATTNCISINTLNGKRITFNLNKSSRLPNIGGVVLDEKIEDMLVGLFSNLSLPWLYVIDEDDFEDTVGYFLKHYPRELVKIFVYYYYFYKNGGMKNRDHANKIAIEQINIFRECIYREQACP